MGSPKLSGDPITVSPVMETAASTTPPLKGKAVPTARQTEPAAPSRPAEPATDQKDKQGLPASAAPTVAERNAPLPPKSVDQAVYVDGQKYVPSASPAAPQKQGERAASMRPPIPKDDRDNQREGYDRSYDETFGAAAFKFSNNGGEAYNMDVSGRVTTETIGDLSSSDDIPDAREDIASTYEAWLGIGSGNAGAYYEDSYVPDRFDLTDQNHVDCLLGARIDPDTGIINIGLSCVAPESDMGQSINNALEALKNPLDWRNDGAVVQRVAEAIVDQDGFVHSGLSCFAPDSVEGQKIVAAKAQIEADPASAAPLALVPASERVNVSSRFGPDAGTASNDPLIASLGQANDYSFSAQALIAAALKDPAPTPESEVDPVLAATPRPPAPAPAPAV